MKWSTLAFRGMDVLFFFCSKLRFIFLPKQTNIEQMAEKFQDQLKAERVHKD